MIAGTARNTLTLLVPASAGSWCGYRGYLVPRAYSWVCCDLHVFDSCCPLMLWYCGKQDTSTLGLILTGKRIYAELATLTIESFDVVAGSIIETVHKSASGAQVLALVARLVYEAAVATPRAAEMYARLCEKIVEEISPAVYHDNIRNEEGHPIAGGRLFRMYLIAWCKKDFEGGWTAVTRSQTWLESIGEDSEPTGGSDVMDVQTKRRRVGVFKFIGALFKGDIDLLTQHVLDEWTRHSPGGVRETELEDNDVECLGMLLAAVGPYVDTPKARSNMKMLPNVITFLANVKNASRHVHEIIWVRL